jgi:hypothetical protein
MRCSRAPELGGCPSAPVVGVVLHEPLIPSLIGARKEVATIVLESHLPIQRRPIVSADAPIQAKSTCQSNVKATTATLMAKPLVLVDRWTAGAIYILYPPLMALAKMIRRIVEPRPVGRLPIQIIDVHFGSKARGRKSEASLLSWLEKLMGPLTEHKLWGL